MDLTFDYNVLEMITSKTRSFLGIIKLMRDGLLACETLENT